MDDRGNPLDGVLIVLENTQGLQFKSDTDNDGVFSILGLGTGVWSLTASKEGYSSFSLQLEVRQLRRNSPVQIVLKKLSGFKGLFADKEAMELFRSGELLVEEEKYADALKLFSEVMEKHPDVYQIRQNIGTCYLNIGEWDKAEREYNFVLDKIIEEHGDFQIDKATALAAFTGLGTVYLKKEDFQKAQEYFSRALDISPEDATSAFNVGEFFFSNQKIDDSIKYFKLAIEIDKDWPDPYLKLGYVYLNKADYDKSLEYFNKFIQIDPDNPEVPTVKKLIETIENLKKNDSDEIT